MNEQYFEIEEYRIEVDSVYQYDIWDHCYHFIGKLNGQTLDDFIQDYENGEGE